MTRETVGFIGIGNMGRPLSTNLFNAGYPLVGYDIAGTRERAPEGAVVGRDAGDVAVRSDVVMMSLPDGDVVREVTEEIIAANDRRVSTIIDLSTSGVAAARAASARCRDSEIGFYDAPVSGGVPGAIAGAVTIMFAGPEEAFERLKPLLEAIGKPFLVGAEPGQGQAMKILNNFLSATAMVATSEAIAFGEAVGLDVELMVDVLNASSGRNDATATKFPVNIIPGTFDRGFTARLLQKDIDLYRDAQTDAGTADRVSREIVEGFRKFHDADPEADMTRIYPFVRDGKL